MPLLYLLDENLRGLLWKHVLRHNAKGLDPIDVVRVGDVDELPLGLEDPDILHWCEAHHRILVSHDENTLPNFFHAHLDNRHHCPGVFLVRDVPFPDVIAFLAVAAYASDPSEWLDQIHFIP